MGTKRSDTLVAYMEPFLKRAVLVCCERLGVSYSEYVRRIIVEDLKERKLLTDTMIAEHLC